MKSCFFIYAVFHAASLHQYFIAHFLPALLIAQKVTVKVQLSAGKTDSLPPATLQLLSLPDSIVAGTQVAKEQGNTFIVQPFSRYLLKVSSAGLAGVEKILAVTDKPIVVPVLMKKKINLAAN